MATNALKRGVSNPLYNKEHIEENMGHDIQTLHKAFDLFNNEFFKDQLDSPIIKIESNMRTAYKVELPQGWIKKKKIINEKNANEENIDAENTNEKNTGEEIINEEECMCMSLSDEIYKFDDLKKVYIRLIEAMILQYDLELKEQYDGKFGKGQRIYKRMITNNNNYFSKAYAQKCIECGLIAEPEEKETCDGEKVKTGRYKLSASDGFNKIYESNEFEKNYELILHIKDDNKQDDAKSMQVYFCPYCGLRIRVTGTKPVLVKCFDDECNGETFILLSEENKDTAKELASNRTKKINAKRKVIEDKTKRVEASKKLMEELG